MRKNKDKYLFLGAGLLILSIWLFSMFYFQMLYTVNYNSYIRYKQDSLSKTVDSVIVGYTQFSDFIYETILNEPRIKELMQKTLDANDSEKMALRTELYDIIKDVYATATEYNFRQMQFHEVGGKSFLRANDPSRYGDELIDLRKSILLVNEQEKAVEGFEVGRLVDGYRFVYPLFYESEFVGSVELEVSMNMVISELYSVFSEHDLGFIVDRSIVDSIAFENQRSNYEISPVSDDYYQEKDVFTFMKLHTANQDIYQDEDFLIKIKSKVSDELGKNESFSTTIDYKGDTYLFQHFAVKDTSGITVGYIYSIGKDTQFRLMLMSRNIAFVSSTFFMVILLIFIHLIRRKNRKITELASTDQLTGIYNRRSFYELANRETERSLRNGMPICIAVLDVDHFKIVNDIYGHLTGDTVLKELTELFQDAVRKTDILARFGGEEFIILLPDTDRENALVVMERIRKKLSHHYFPQTGLITVSIGLAEADPHEGIDLSIERADKALYEAKRTGRDKINTAW